LAAVPWKLLLLRCQQLLHRILQQHLLLLLLYKP
jgi:hypothetical protein